MEGSKISKQDLKRARPENVRRLARALHLHGTEDMSDMRVEVVTDVGDQRIIAVSAGFKQKEEDR